jgi:competence protein ComEC
MLLKYLAKNSRLYQSPSGSKLKTIMIYGDEVEHLGLEENNRTKVRFRHQVGWMKSEDLMSDGVLEIYFIDVGQGDSAFIVTPGRMKILIDGGTSDRALRFLSWKYFLDEVNELSPIIIDLLVLTHADEDHIGGLIEIISSPKIKIKRIIHSGLAIFKDGVFNEKLGNLVERDGQKFLSTSHNAIEELDDGSLSGTFLRWKKAILDEGNIVYESVDTDTESLEVLDPSIKIEVLGPKVLKEGIDNSKLYAWFGDHAHSINGHSVVLRLIYNNVKVLFSGDLNSDGEKNLLSDNSLKSRMDSNILKAPHHGSHEFYRPWLDAVNPQISVISSGDDRDHGHPRAVFLGAVGNASRKKSLLFSTEIAANFVEIEHGLDSDEHESDVLSPRELFKRRLHGMINVRSNGEQIYAARRIASGYMWEYYVIAHPEPRSNGQ